MNTFTATDMDEIMCFLDEYTTGETAVTAVETAVTAAETAVTAVTSSRMYTFDSSDIADAFVYDCAHESDEEGQAPARACVDFGEDDLMDLLGDFDLDSLDITPAAAMPAVAFAAPIVFKTKDEELELAHAAGKFLVHTEFPYRHHLLFDSLDHFHAYQAAQPEHQRCFHEIIIGDGPRNLYVDIDDSDLPGDEYGSFGGECVRVFQTAVLAYFNTALSAAEIVIISASGYSATKQVNKFSLHIRAPSLATNPREMAAFAKFFSQRLSRPGNVDLCVYKSFQCIRMLGSTKLGDARHSKILRVESQTRLYVHDDKSDLAASMLGYKPQVARNIYVDPVPAQNAERERAYIAAENDTIQYILDNAAEHYIGYEYRNVRGNRIYFNRCIYPVAPPACDICGRLHDSDNALFMTINAATVTRGCLRDTTHAHIHVLDLPEEMAVATPAAPAATTRLTTAERLAKLIAEPAKDAKLALGAFKNLKQVIYNEPKMRPYPAAPTVIIQAQKGVGKTEELVRLIATKFVGKTIVALSHRETFTSKLIADLPGFIGYNEFTGPIDLAENPRVVVQIESLYRLVTQDWANDGLQIDLLIMDESESIISQLSSGLCHDFNASWDVFNYLTLYSKQVIAMDANITNRTIMTLADRAAIGDTPCVYVRNTLARAEDSSIQITCDMKQWRAALFKDLDAGLNIFIPTNSATEAKVLALDIGKRYPDKRVNLYTGDSDQQVKRDDIANISVAWNCDVLIFTPTITSGVSYTDDNFDKTYGWFKHNSCDVLACDQMLGRVRSISTKSAVLYMDADRSTAWTSFKKLKAAVLASRANLSAVYGAQWLSYETKPEGIVVHNQRYFNIMLANATIRNNSRADFMGEFIRLLARTGVRMSVLPVDVVVAAVERTHKVSKAEAKAIEVAKIVDAADITDKDYEDLRSVVDKTPDQKNAMARMRMRRRLAWDGPIDAVFVTAFNSDQKFGWFHMLNEAATKTLAEIQAEQRERFERYCDDDGDWNHTYSFESHRIAQGILTRIGFAGITDTKVLSVAELTAAIAPHKAALIAEYDHAVATIGVRSSKPKLDTVKSCLFYINAILRPVYGIKIVAGRRVRVDGVQVSTDFKIEADHGFSFEDGRFTTVPGWDKKEPEPELAPEEIQMDEMLNTM